QIYGLAIQGLALVELGRADEGAEQSARARALLAEQERLEGAEQILYIHAAVCTAAGRHDEAVAAIRAARREMDSKSEQLADRTLRAIYAESTIPRAIRDLYQRLVGLAPG
ncbi:MAG: hypothetical protein AAGC55_05675, partial [Myxococcota bacterium]